MKCIIWNVTFICEVTAAVGRLGQGVNQADEAKMPCPDTAAEYPPCVCTTYIRIYKCKLKLYICVYTYIRVHTCIHEYIVKYCGFRDEYNNFWITGLVLLALIYNYGEL
jgi:hypothetical protein